MRTVVRAAVVLVALASIALAGAVGVSAASPAPSVPVIGGDLEAFTQRVVLTSRSTRPVAVTMTPAGPFTLTPASFNLQPGETITLAVAGDPRGRVSARLAALTAATGDTSSVTLEVAFPQPAPTDWLSFVLVGLAALVGALGLALGLRRASRYTLRVERR